MEPRVYPPTDVLVQLNVGGRPFFATRDTLTKRSAYFRSLLSGHELVGATKGSYFVDADPEYFEYVLQYLRRGVFPIFYDNQKGIDYHLYHALLQEARFFDVPCLRVWLEEQKYLEAIEIKHQFLEYDHHDPFGNIASLKRRSFPANVTTEYHPHWVREAVFICPLDKKEHRGKPYKCGRACKREQGDEPPEYVKEQTLHVVVINKTVLFNEQICQPQEE